MLNHIKHFFQKLLGKKKLDLKQIQSYEKLKPAESIAEPNLTPVNALKKTHKITLPDESKILQTSVPAQTKIFAPQPPIITRQPFNATIPRQAFNKPPILLLILDGWGIGPDNAGNAITLAQTPNLDNYWLSFPHTQLQTSGQAVGLPKGQDGNTETGHLNIGAGSIVYQELARINNAVADQSFSQNPAFLQAFNHVLQNESTLHLMGLVGSGKVHSNIEHLYSLLDMCAQAGLSKVVVHAFTDGRDSPPNSGIDYIKNLQNYLKKLGIGKIGSISGRYYAMDRDKKWDRIEKTYNCLTLGSNNIFANPVEAMKHFYKQNITDEFIEPSNIVNQDGTLPLISDNDGVIFFNFRVDRPRELTRAFVMPDFEQGIKQEDYDPHVEEFHKTSLYKDKNNTTFKRQRILQNLFFVTMTTYEDILPVTVAFAMQKINNSIGSFLANRGVRQLRTTETEKGKFVTEYINAKRKTPNPGEDWIIYPSKGVKSYDEVPQMTAPEITAEIVNQLNQSNYDAIIANICNGDMVGHTGNLQAAIKACEVVDQSVGLIVKAMLAKGGTVLLTADHGNVEEMINNQTGQIDTEHSIYPVPFIVINQQLAGRSQILPTGILADVAPTMIHLMGFNKPEAMNGQTLFNQQLF